MTDRRTLFRRAHKPSAASHPSRLDVARPSVWFRGVAIAGVLSLTAAACADAETVEDQVVSSDASEPDEPASSESASDGTDTDEDGSADSDATSEAAMDDQSDGETDNSADDEGESDVEDQAVVEEAEPLGPPRSVFPDVEVVEIASGQPLNVADELSGSGKATLLWFFAPH